ncbi:MAG: hypothetical protein WKG03_10360, partial [Telluria sp.]
MCCLQHQHTGISGPGRKLLDGGEQRHGGLRIATGGKHQDDVAIAIATRRTERRMTGRVKQTPRIDQAPIVRQRWPGHGTRACFPAVRLQTNP